MVGPFRERRSTHLACLSAQAAVVAIGTVPGESTAPCSFDGLNACCSQPRINLPCLLTTLWTCIMVALRC